MYSCVLFSQNEINFSLYDVVSLFNALIYCSLPCQNKSNRLEDKLFFQNMTYVFLPNLHTEVTRVDFTTFLYVFLLLWLLPFAISKSNIKVKGFELPTLGIHILIESCCIEARVNFENNGKLSSKLAKNDKEIKGLTYFATYVFKAHGQLNTMYWNPPCISQITHSLPQ